MKVHAYAEIHLYVHTVPITDDVRINKLTLMHTIEFILRTTAASYGKRVRLIYFCPAEIEPELEKKLKKTVLTLSARRIQSRWVKENKTQTRPNSRTLTAVYSAVLDELLLPGVIIGSRTRVRLDGSSFSKIVLDKTEQHFLEDRVDAIKFAYKQLAHRDIEIEFQKESTYYTLKKGDRR